MIRKLTSLVLVITTTAAFGQHTNFNTQRNWSLNKKEIMIGFGATQFLGDLGGRDRIGTDYSLADWDWPSTWYGGMIGYRYRFHPYWATTCSVNFGRLRGDDALTNEIIRKTRNLHFRSNVFEYQQRIEAIIVANEKIGNRYSLSRHSKKMHNHNEQLYLFTGIGVVYYEPKAYMPSAPGANKNGYVKLRKMHTEGQGLDGGPDNYLPVTATIPFGIGYRWGIAPMWRMGIEATYVKTFSDYIDDVHGTYYDPAILASEYGAEAAYLSNPAQQNTNWFAPGQQRGDKQKDAYFYLNVTFARNVTYRPYTSQRRKYQWKGRYKF